jgi:hypothetical protein
MSQNIFSNVFSTLLEQDEGLPTPAQAGGNAAQDEANFKAGDEGSDAADLGASDISPEDRQFLQHAAQREMQMIKNLQSWIVQLDGMVDYLNGTDGNSIQMQLKKAVADTIFDKMRTSEAKKIARVAKEISALAETFKGYLATSNEPKYRFV